MVEELQAITNHSCFYQVSTVLKAALLPSQTGHLLEAVRSQINMLLFSYQDDLEGIPLCYSDIELIKGKEYCRILAADPWLHVDISLKLLVFKPKTGNTLTGRVTMVSESHISLLVLDMFNASISGENLRKKYNYNDSLGQWEMENGVISEGELISFKVGLIQQSFGVLTIDGIPI